MTDVHKFNSENRFNLPEELAGKPVMAHGATKIPYKDLNTVAGFEGTESDPDLQEVARITREVQNRILATSMIVKGRVVHHDAMKTMKVLDREMQPRTKGGILFVFDETGETTYQGVVGGSYLQSIGNFDKAMNTRLDEKRAKALDMQIRHLDVLLDLLDCPEGALILETGAGADYERIKGLKAYAEGKKAKLVCHDPSPLAAHSSQWGAPRTPYISLPQSSEFLSLPFADIKRPKIITLKDVVSSMAFGEINELCEVAGNIGAEKIMVTQSLGLADNSNMMPEGWRPEEQEYKQFLLMNLMNSGILQGLPIRMVQSVGAFISFQLEHIARTILMELAKRTLMEGVKGSAGMENTRTIMVEQKTILEKEQAIQYLTKFFPKILTDFKTGKFNTLTVGPFGTHTSKEGNDNQGNLCLKNLQYHWEFSKTSIENNSTSEDPNSSIDFGNGQDFTIQDRFKWVDPRIVDMEFRINGNPETDVISKMPYNQIAYYRKFAAQMAHHLIFEIWGKHLGHPHIAKFLGTDTERKIKNTFF